MEKSVEPNLFMTRLHEADDVKEAVRSWGRTVHAMSVLGFSDGEVSAVRAVLAAIYHLGVAGAVTVTGCHLLFVILFTTLHTLYAVTEEMVRAIVCGGSPGGRSEITGVRICETGSVVPPKYVIELSQMQG